MSTNPRAGTLPEPADLVNVPRLVRAYYELAPDPTVRAQRVSFGTSGHRGRALEASFNQAHILAVVEAVCRYRHRKGIDGPLFLGIDTHALSEPAFASALEVLAAHEIEVRVDDHDGYTPTPVISHAIRAQPGATGLADGIVITLSHNPPEDGGIKYNPPHGGPADTEVTRAIEDEANALLAEGLASVRRVPFARARRLATTVPHDYVGTYVGELSRVVDFEPLRGSALTLGVDPLGGAGVAYWGRIAEHHRLPLTVVSEEVDPTFRFMSLDWDGKIRMDCSSPHAMQRLIGLRERFDVAWACDTDHDRHGIVARTSGLLNPNHYLAVAIAYLLASRTSWPQRVARQDGRSSGMIDRVAARLGRFLMEGPSASSGRPACSTARWRSAARAPGSFLAATAPPDHRQGRIVMGLLAAMTAFTGATRAALRLTRDLGDPVYERIDAPATPEQGDLGSSPSQVTASELAGRRSRPPHEGAGQRRVAGGFKVTTANGWFAARPSGPRTSTSLRRASGSSTSDASRRRRRR
jgi:phosphoglucomutase